MATIEGAVKSRVLEEYALPGWETRLARRPLYVAPALFLWADAKPELIDEKRKIGGRLLIEHLERLFCDLRCSARPAAGDVRRMMPNKHGILSAHAPGLRVYGWCAGPSNFVPVAAALESETKADRSLNDAKRDEVRAFVRANGLETTILRGDIRALFPAPA